ncbi:hypothetical protein [Euzebya sp.]|uniref:hypothetical protein n=1 Tax=Euzebya sp. TaxID=1971409 RepID=UPI003516E566
MTRRALSLLVLLAAVVAGCGETPGDVLPPPRDGRSGIQLSGTLGGRQAAVNDGLPEVNFGDCDVAEGPDRDLCVITEDISGELIVIVFENPAAFVAGERLAIDDASCGDADACDAVTDVALVDVRVGDGPRVTATGGSVTLEVVEDLARYRGDLDVRLPDGGRLTGTFDLIPRPDEISRR